VPSTDRGERSVRPEAGFGAEATSDKRTDHAYLQSSAVSGPSDCVQYAVDLGGLRLVTADAVVPYEPHGALDPARLAHLDRLLAETAGSPTIVALHHPPFRTLLGPLDEIGLKVGADQLAALISRHQRIERVICGHFHRSIQARWAGTLAMCAPSTAHQLVLDLGVEAPAVFAMEPPGFLMHAWDEAGTVVSHQVAIGEFPDEKAAASAILAAAAGGSLSNIETTVAMTAKEATATFQSAGKAAKAFRSAGRS